MINRLIIFLIRKKLGLKKNERFRFANQKKKGTYWFSDTALIKRIDINQPIELSTVPLNWLLDKDCKIIKQI